MLEKKFQTLFYGWLKQNPPTKSAAHELKSVKGSTFNLSQWVKKSPHQARSLMLAKNKWMYHKISDQSMGTKPFDSFVMCGADAFLVVWFDAEKAFCILDIDDILPLIHKGKSLKFSEIDPKFIKKLS